MFKIKFSSVLNLLSYALYITYGMAILRLQPLHMLLWCGVLFLFFICQAVLHELGHFLGGLFTAHKFLLFYAGPFGITRTLEGGYKVSWNKSRGYQCVMIPQKDHYVLYNLGGVLANLISVAVAVMIMIISREVSMLLLAIIFSGSAKALGNAIPIMSADGPNDAKIVAMLRQNPLEKYQYFRYMKVYEAYFCGQPMQLYPDPEKDHGFFYESILELMDSPE